jgi:alkylation response protein AidB-like acyl-CoA dehydrogenase
VTALAPDDFRQRCHEWIEAHERELDEFRELPRDLDEQFETLSRLQRMLFDATWLRYGWPEDLGGLGGSPLLRSILSEELAATGYPPPFSFGMLEVLAPAVARFAPRELAATVLPALLSGRESWCQGFSEPDAGSDLASLRLRADADGDGWRLEGQKVWTSWAKYADRCVVLARTGTLADSHRGITALFVDMDAPGLTVRPLEAMNGAAEFGELFFDGVPVGRDRLLGTVGGGWQVAMFVLACERGAVAWQRQAWMHRRLEDLVAASGSGEAADERIGAIYADLYALRLRSRATVRSFAAGEIPGAEASLDKLMMSRSEQALFDAAVDLLADDVLVGTGRSADGWRDDFLYSRAASIYGGTTEIQLGIVAERLLALPRAR